LHQPSRTSWRQWHSRTGRRCRGCVIAVRGTPTQTLSMQTSSRCRSRRPCRPRLAEVSIGGHRGVALAAGRPGAREPDRWHARRSGTSPPSGRGRSRRREGRRPGCRPAVAAGRGTRARRGRGTAVVSVQNLRRRWKPSRAGTLDGGQHRVAASQSFWGCRSPDRWHATSIRHQPSRGMKLHPPVPLHSPSERAARRRRSRGSLASPGGRRPPPVQRFPSSLSAFRVSGPLAGTGGRPAPIAGVGGVVAPCRQHAPRSGTSPSPGGGASPDPVAEVVGAVQAVVARMGLPTHESPGRCRRWCRGLRRRRGTPGAESLGVLFGSQRGRIRWGHTGPCGGTVIRQYPVCTT
jgi:hypothetical protein